jgi:hypothetical protein
MSRYLELLELIDKYKPQSLVEIGVWNGANAIRMINRAKQHHADVTYTGYDLFEEASADTDSKEFNVKSHNHMNAVAAYIRSETGVTPVLVKGDTNVTLPTKTIADFVFLDGGHSIETITNDYSKVGLSKVVVLDDYYTNGPNTEKYGCNKVVANLKNITIMPTKDPVKGGGFTQLVVVA